MGNEEMKLTCEEFGVGTLGLLHSGGGPGVEDLRLHDGRLHEVCVLVARALPRLLVLDQIEQFLLAAHPGHVALAILSEAKRIKIS